LRNPAHAPRAWAAPLSRRTRDSVRRRSTDSSWTSATG
jgi:hypothetical protein